MRKIILNEVDDKILFLGKYYYRNALAEYNAEGYFINPLNKGSKKFFQDVYDTFNGKKGTQHSLLMTELGELNCAYIDLKNSENILYDDYSPSDHENFDSSDNIPLDLKMVARKLATEDHVREEVADVLMLLYQFAIRAGIDTTSVSLKEQNKSMDLQTAIETLTYNVSCFDHQLNRQERGRADFSPEKATQYLISAITYANLVAFKMDNETRSKPVNKNEYVLDDKAKNVQQWFDFKVDRTQKLIDSKKTH